MADDGDESRRWLPRNFPLGKTAAEQEFDEMNRRHEAGRRAIEALRPSIEAERLMQSIRPGREMITLMESMRPSAEVQKMMEAMRPSREVENMLKTFRPDPHIEKMVQSYRATEDVCRIAEDLTIPRDMWQAFSTELADSLARIVKPFKAMEQANASLTEFARWQSALDAGLKSFESSHWMLATTPGQSAVGYAHLMRLNEAARTTDPFSPRVDELVREELGDPTDDVDGNPLERDAKALDAGMDAAVIAFPPTEYPSIIRSVGFRFIVPAPPVPVAVDNFDPTAVFDPTFGALLTALEQHLRHHIEISLRTLHGDGWLKRSVHGDVRKRWQGRQDEDRSAGRPVYDLIHYSDFVELGDIIVRGNNWPAFQAVFQHKQALIESLRRLQPIRNADRHSRPLGRADALSLVCEATRLFSLLGHKILD